MSEFKNIDTTSARARRVHTQPHDKNTTLQKVFASFMTRYFKLFFFWEHERATAQKGKNYNTITYKIPKPAS